MHVEMESDIDGTANLVASVTLESDSLSEAPKSSRSKRRRKISKHEKLLKMDSDFYSKVSLSNLEADDNNFFKKRKHCMEWEISTVSATCEVSSSETNSSSEINVDADDEQSDWAGAECLKSLKYHKRNLLIPHKEPECSSLCSTSNNIEQFEFSKCFNFNTLKLVERFLNDSQQKKLILYNAYKLSIIKKYLINTPTVQTIKRGRGTIILKKS